MACHGVTYFARAYVGEAYVILFQIPVSTVFVKNKLLKVHDIMFLSEPGMYL